jgi:4-aminobutyrate aminotransferase-like enzyme/Ser/Thr protein kinase RdoA (MazF antagonist)
VTTADEVLSAAPPKLTSQEAVDAATEHYGVAAAAAVDCGSERDRTFALEDSGGKRLAVLKVSNELEDPEVLDMEAAVALHVTAVDPDLRVALPWRSALTGDPGSAAAGDAPSELRAEYDYHGTRHWLRLYDLLPGESRINATELSDPALTAWGSTAARLARAMQGFQHPRAKRQMLWDIQYAAEVLPLTQYIDDPEQRRLVAATLEQFQRQLQPLWPSLRAQVLHTDISVDNTLSDAQGLVTGIIDFGDMSYTALISDIASVLDSLAAGRDGEEVFRLARLVLDGYQRHIELTEPELRMVPLAWATRSAVTIAISSWRASRGLEDRDFAERYNARCARVLATMERIGWEQLPQTVGVAVNRERSEQLAARRAAAFGPAMEALFYEVPVDVVSGEGSWITDVCGRRLLDAYNNVPTIGHAHPRVVTAIARQSRQINTHMRYLHPLAIELAERLTALAGHGLDTVILVNSGSEANDLAWRMARAVTGNSGGLCSACAYHGITEVTAAFSPEGWLTGVKPDNIETWHVPDPFRGLHLDAAQMTAALDRLQARGLKPAAAILDGLLMSDGVHDLDPALIRQWVDQVHAAGGLWIADEVQASHGRNGESFFAYEHLGISPDFVTLGKPMGNGHPVAAVLTRREIAQEIGKETVLFSTFGGNPVSAAAALAVLDAFEDERVLARVHQTGKLLRSALGEVESRAAVIGEVRGLGLAYGIEFVASAADKSENAERARAVRDRMRLEGVLVGTTGPSLNVLKLRPPLAFSGEHVPLLAAALQAALAATG